MRKWPFVDCLRPSTAMVETAGKYSALESGLLVIVSGHLLLRWRHLKYVQYEKMAFLLIVTGPSTALVETTGRISV